MKAIHIMTMTLALCGILPVNPHPIAAIIRLLIKGIGHTFVKTSAAAGVVAKVAKVGGTVLKAGGAAVKSPLAKKLGVATLGGGVAYG